MDEPMSDIDDFPGGSHAMSSRPVHFFWILDTSGSMGVKDKIGQLNRAIRDAIPAMRGAAGDNPTAQLLIRAVAFDSSARWHISSPVPIDQFEWTDVSAGG